MLKNIFRSLIFALLGKRTHVQRPDVFDVMFAHPELSLHEASWRLNWGRIVARWIFCFLFLAGLIGFVYWLWM